MNEHGVKTHDATRASLWDMDEAVGLLQVLTVRLVAELQKEVRA